MFNTSVNFDRYGQTGTGKTFTMEGERSPNEEYTWEEVFIVYIRLLSLKWLKCSIIKLGRTPLSEIDQSTMSNMNLG